MTKTAEFNRLPVPTPELVATKCEEFDSENRLCERALRQLREMFPHNTEPSHVLLKVIVLNKLYSARVKDTDVFTLAEHIAQLGIDAPIKQGDPVAVRKIFKCENLPMYYSFATKFCSWHNPTAYPIWDSYIDECLWAYNKRDRFAPFLREDLGYIEKLIAIVGAFRSHYGLDGYTFKDIDKFLWLTGRELLAT